MIGQMLMIGFRGSTPESSTHVLRLLRDGTIGGVVLFDYDVATKTTGRNIVSPRQLRALTRALRDAAAAPPFIAVDQEGGRVSRLKPASGFPETVSQHYLGTIDRADSTRMYAERTARVLNSEGISVNFAPVLDVNITPSNPVIGRLDRSFSSDTDVVARNAEIMLRTFRANGILSAVKHFPGHGSSTTDSHAGFTDVTRTWKHEELAPFARVIRDGLCDMVMTAHVYNAALDADAPATLSPGVITRLLRDSLGFGGVVVSDDMQMQAIAARYTLADAIRRAVLAGVDILLFGNNTGVYDDQIAEKAHAILRDLVRSGSVPIERIAASWRRISALKQRLAGRQGGGF